MSEKKVVEIVGVNVPIEQGKDGKWAVVKDRATLTVDGKEAIKGKRLSNAKMVLLPVEEAAKKAKEEEDKEEQRLLAIKKSETDAAEKKMELQVKDITKKQSHPKNSTTNLETLQKETQRAERDNKIDAARNAIQAFKENVKNDKERLAFDSTALKSTQARGNIRHLGGGQRKTRKKGKKKTKNRVRKSRAHKKRKSHKSNNKSKRRKH